MDFIFNCFGHTNVLSKHKNTLEFTKDQELSLNGDCILGVKSDFDFSKLMEFVSMNKGKKVLGKIIVDELVDEFSFFVNPDFCDEHEIVLRRGEFNSGRTLGFNLDKAAKDIKREIVERLKDNDNKFEVSFFVG